MKYLSAEQALADFPVMARNFSRSNFSHIDLTPRSTPWVFVGGSYSGMRAAFMRKTYPDVIFASMASSAPVEARIDMSAYYDQVYRGMVGKGLSNCTRDIHAAVEEMDRQLTESPESAAALKIKILGPAADLNSNEGFADAMSTVFFDFQSFGVDGTPGPLREFCDWLSTDPKSKHVSNTEGFAVRKGAQYVLDRWAAWPGFKDLVNNYTPTECLGPNHKFNSTMFLPNGTAIGLINLNATKTANNTVSCKLDERNTDPGTISWAWQYCSQWGYFQTVNTGTSSLISKLNTLEHQSNLCKRQFPDGIASGFLPENPQSNITNERFGGWDIQVSNVYWSGGEYDPWRTLSPLTSEDFAPDDIVISSEIPACGAFPQKHHFFGYLMPDAEHCFDFRTTFPAGNKSRSFFVTALHKWLGCFREDRKHRKRDQIDAVVKPGKGKQFKYEPISIGKPSLPVKPQEVNTAAKINGHQRLVRPGRFSGRRVRMTHALEGH
jgi:hypothetical protein